MDPLQMVAYQKKAKELAAHLVFVDESGFLMIPNVKRTWAPRGKTPIHYHSLSREKISAITALTVSPRRHRLGLYTHLWRNDVSSEEIVIFLEELIRHLRGKIYILWDQAAIHKNALVSCFIQKHPRVRLEYLPAYAPELNPAEHIWNQDDAALSNTSPQTIADLEQLLTTSNNRLTKSQKLLRACIKASKLPWAK
jgi:hypothetical protein